MSRVSRKKAFTLLELLVVVAIIALLIAILLPALQEAKEQGRRAKCLSHMRAIASASNAYAADDEFDLVIPISHQLQYPEHGEGWNNAVWVVRTMMPYAYGGRTPQYEWRGNTLWRWAAEYRPLNLFMYDSKLVGEEAKKAELFHCPSDVGYPETRYPLNDDIIHDCPKAVRAIPCYDFTGNSYRTNPAGLFFYSGSNALCYFTIGAQGHALETLPEPSQLLLYCEPMFYNMTYELATMPYDPTRSPLVGWHRRVMEDNVAFVDGSARATRAAGLHIWADRTLDDMNFSPPHGEAPDWLRRGEGWRTDCYPTPGVWIPTLDNNGSIVTPPNLRPEQYYANQMWGWPFKGYSILKPNF